MTLPHNWSAPAREKLAIVLMSAMLLGWIGGSLAVQGLQIHDQGYGSGIVNRGHLPDQIRQRFGAPEGTTPQQLMNETSR